MSELEMHSLVGELEASDFWDRERSIRRMIEQTMQHRRDSAMQQSPYYMAMPGMFSVATATDTLTSTTFKTIAINLPPWLKPEEARLLAEVQIREQMDPGYDPTDR